LLSDIKVISKLLRIKLTHPNPLFKKRGGFLLFFKEEAGRAKLSFGRVKF